MRSPHPHRLLNARLTRLILCVVVLLQLSAVTSGGDSVDAEKVAKWVADLKSENVRVRLTAAYNYDQLQPINEATIAHIAAALTDGNPYVRKYCASALGEIDAEPRLVIPALTQTLRDPNRDVREHSLVALIKIGAPAVPMLVESLQTVEGVSSATKLTDFSVDDPAVWIQHNAGLALIEIGIPAVPALMDASVGKDTQTYFAANALSTIARNEKSSLPSFLDDKDYRLRLWANQGLERRVELLEMLQHGDPRFRVTIIKTLGEIGGAAQTTPVLMKLLNDSDLDVRRAAVGALARSHDDSVAPTLARMFPEQSKEMKRDIIDAFRRLDDRSEPILNVLGHALTDPELEIRQSALDTLLYFNAGARVAATAVRMLAQRPEARRYYSTYQVKQIGLAAIPPLIELLKDPDETIRLFALKCLNDIDGQDDRKITALRPLLQDSSGKVRLAAAMSLIGTSEAEAALQLLMSLAKDPDLKRRQEVVAVVRQSIPKRSVSESFLSQALQDSSVEVRQVGLELITNEENLSSRLIGLLIEKLSDTDGVVPVRAARLLTRSRRQLTSAQAKEITAKLVVAIRGRDFRSDDNSLNYFTLLYALTSIGERSAVDESLLGFLSSDNPKLVNQALTTLEQRFGQDPRLTAAIIKLLESPNATIRLLTIRTLWTLEADFPSIYPHVKKLLNDPDPGIRREVLDSVGRLRSATTVSVTDVEPLLRDADPLVRLEAMNAVFVIDSDSTRYAARLIQELSALPDPAVTDEEKRVRGTIFEMLTDISSSAVAVLMNSLESGKPVVRRHISNVLTSLSSIPPSILPTLIRALKDPDLEVRTNAARLIDRLAEKAKVAAPGLLELLEDPDERARLVAANALFAIGVDLASAGRVFNAIINDDSIRRALRPTEELNPISGRDFADFKLDSVARWEAIPRLDGVKAALIISGSSRNVIPDFPWPPPRYAESYVLPRTSIARDKDTLSDAYERLKQALSRNGYDTGLFNVPGGIALATKVERIYEDGKSYPAPYRWTKGKVPPGSVREWFSALFMERPGQFRMFVFIVTNQSSVSGGKADLAEPAASALARSGAGVLPRQMEATPFKGLNCHVIIYRFQKRVGQIATIEHADPIGLSPQVHLRQSGLLSQLGL